MKEMTMFIITEEVTLNGKVLQTLLNKMAQLFFYTSTSKVEDDDQMLSEVTELLIQTYLLIHQSIS